MSFASDYKKECAANRRLPCKRCPQKRWGAWELCETHARELIRRREDGARRGAATRKARREEKFPDRPTPDRRWSGFASNFVKCGIRMGVLPILDGSIACVDCGAVATQYEHRDYGRPLDVEPTCRSCNLRRGPARVPSRADYPWAHDRGPPEEIRDAAQLERCA